MSDYLWAEAEIRGQYRYSLTRRWEMGNDFATFVMLNPSTADGIEDDPTIRRCVGFARSLGCDGLLAVNLYAFRATNPNAMFAADDPVGPLNATWLAEALRWASSWCSPVIAAWGTKARDKEARAFAQQAADTGVALQCLGVTKDGHPKHPLYLPRDTPLRRWVYPAREVGPA